MSETPKQNQHNVAPGDLAGVDVAEEVVLGVTAAVVALLSGVKFDRHGAGDEEADVVLALRVSENGIIYNWPYCSRT